ncbi:hypothetical protein BV20DRAFT_365551 [Pilatotrama ljubarskyi]|nr:hypothetical protein BV20DRAFT_365551 [Pilatotrama ljubarskyi]
MYSSQRGRYRGHDERDRHAGLCDYVHDRDSRDYDDAEQHRGRSKSPPPRRSSPSQGRWDRTVVPRNREPHGRHHITPSHRRGSRRQNTNVRGGRHDGSDADDRDIEEDQEIPEELDGEADVNWAFYNKLFRTLRATKSSKWSIR